MYWFQRWFEKIAAALRSESGTIQETVKSQGDAIRIVLESAKRDQNEAAGIIASAIKSVGTDVPLFEKTQSEKEYGLQKRLYWATLGAGVAAAIYAGLAYLTLHEIQKQTSISNSAVIEARNALDTSQSQFDRTMKLALVQTAAGVKAA